VFAEEWPLLLFTLLSQLSIGTFVLLLLVGKLLDKEHQGVNPFLAICGSGAAVVLMAGAQALSMIHLGSPLLGFLAVLNVGSSWLSREILAGGGYFSLAAAYVYTAWRGKPACYWLARLRWLAF